jgi:hypothetical protein
MLLGTAGVCWGDPFGSDANSEGYRRAQRDAQARARREAETRRWLQQSLLRREQEKAQALKREQDRRVLESARAVWEASRANAADQTGRLREAIEAMRAWMRKMGTIVMMQRTQAEMAKLGVTPTSGMETMGGVSHWRARALRAEHTGPGYESGGFAGNVRRATSQERLAWEARRGRLHAPPPTKTSAQPGATPWIKKKGAHKRNNRPLPPPHRVPRRPGPR